MIANLTIVNIIRVLSARKKVIIPGNILNKSRTTKKLDLSQETSVDSRLIFVILIDDLIFYISNILLILKGIRTIILKTTLVILLKFF
jgi:hypothetical protein